MGGEGSATKEWLNVSNVWSESSISKAGSLGLRSLGMKSQLYVPEIADKLAMKPIGFRLNDRAPVTTNSTREQEEADFVQRFCQIDVSIILWHDTEVYWVVRNPLVVKLDSRLRLAQATSLDPNTLINPQRELIEVIFNDLRGARSSTEIEFFSYQYIRQKSALLFFIDLVLKTLSGTFVSEDDKRFTEQALVESEIDPRIVLAFLPNISVEIQQAKDGIWVQGGLKTIFESFFTQQDLAKTMNIDPTSPYGDNLLQVVKRFLLFWRRKKGNPSVVDGVHIFATVDAAILHILLMLDASKPPGPVSSGSLRAELYAVVDNGVDCFERAVRLLNDFNRLYVLSRLYGKKKSPSMVLSTWKRILDNSEDIKGEFTDGETEVRKYLSRLKDRNLVIEYGTWLANRNPKIGVQVFADESSKMVIPTADALQILRERSPNAVKDYLEYLVFGKKVGQTKFAVPVCTNLL
jgi:hypothetical protein